jgi:bifunctional oligoribonuclease and PAP phosphatase NrnA
MNIQKQIVDKIKSATKIVITAHKSPDGDSIGSSMALFQFCKKLNKNVVVCHPDPAPKFLLWVDDVEQIINYEQQKQEVQKQFAEADLIFSLDYNEPNRMGNEMAQFLTDSKAFKIMIDHHLNPAGFADIAWSDTSSCSTCQMIFELIEHSDSLELLDVKIASPIYLGIMTDTGSFRYNSVLPKTHMIASKLLEVGIKQDEIHENVFDVNSPEKLILRGYAISEKLVILKDIPVAYISLSESDFSKFKHEKGDTEGLVNVALSIENVKIAAFFAEKDNEVKISFRSKGYDNPVNLLAQNHFNGGGHANAAGGKSNEKLEDVIAKFLILVKDYV